MNNRTNNVQNQVPNQNQYYYHGFYLPQMSNQNPAMLNEYPYYYYNPSYQFPPNIYGMPPYYHQYMMEQPKTLEESLSLIYQRGIVNNIMGAFFINDCIEKQKNNEKRKVPISMVELNSEQDNKSNKENSKSEDNNNQEENGKDKSESEKEKNLEEEERNGDKISENKNENEEKDENENDIND